MALEKKKSKSNAFSIRRKTVTSKNSGKHYVICIKNDEYPASLESRKIYKTVPDQEASKAGLIRVIDESGEDYLYPQEYFVEIKLPRAVEKAVQLAS